MKEKISDQISIKQDDTGLKISEGNRFTRFDRNTNNIKRVDVIINTRAYIYHKNIIDDTDAISSGLANKHSSWQILTDLTDIMGCVD